jgi:hypothetical protein
VLEAEVGVEVGIVKIQHAGQLLAGQAAVFLLTGLALAWGTLHEGGGQRSY